MKRKYLRDKVTVVLFFILTLNFSFGQSLEVLSVDKEYHDISLKKDSDVTYQLNLKKDGLYKFKVLQNGIDIRLQLFDSDGRELFNKDTPNSYTGYELIEYSPTKTDNYILKFVPRTYERNPEQGKINIFIHKLTKSELKRREEIAKELEAENEKLIQTLDIEHFWEAFDALKKAKTYRDSINLMQTVYIDRATNGFKDFIKKWSITPESMIKAIAKYPKFYNSIKQNTFKVKNSDSTIKEIVENFRAIYPGFKDKRVCFFIGNMNVGGTVSDNFLLIGTEIMAATQFNDLSELNPSFKEMFKDNVNVVQEIKKLVAHEYVHTQQTDQYDEEAIICPLLYDTLQEGIADFIGELISDVKLNSEMYSYGDKHEAELWEDFKNELCNTVSDNWLFNGEIEDKPSDLGYYIGYKIAEEYMKNAENKDEAIIEMIEMNDPIRFLQKSNYDQKKKQ